MHYHYFSNTDDQDYLGRIIIFVKHNLWLYIPDFILILLLAAPPYSWFETKLIISIALILSFRDIILLKHSIYHLGKFKIDGDSVSIAILHKSKLHKQHSGLISEFDIKIIGKRLFTKFLLYKNQELIHCQYNIGNWTPKKINELNESFYEIKRELGFWRMFKGPMVN